MRRVMMAVVAVAGLAGCAGGQIQYERKFGSSPTIGEQATATPGDFVYTEFDYTAAAGAVISGGYSDVVQLVNLSIVPGSSLVKAGDDYCTTYNAFTAMLGNPLGPACLRDTDGDGAFDRLAGGNIFPTDMPPLPYRLESIGAGAGFRKELLYQGVQGDTVRLSYREYANDMARPAFQQDLTYNIEAPGPTKVTFKGVRLEIAGADNNGIRYKILSGFTGQ